MSHFFAYVLTACIGIIAFYSFYIGLRLILKNISQRKELLRKSYETIIIRSLEELGHESSTKLISEAVKAHKKIVEGVCLKLCQYYDPEIRKRAVALYGSLGFEDARIKELGSIIPKRRAEACRRLGIACSEKAIPHLVDLIDDRSQRVREEAFVALMITESHDALPYLAKILSRPTRWRMSQVESLVVRTAPDSARFLTACLEDERDSVRLFSAQMLGRINADKTVLEKLAKASRDKDINVASRATESLGESEKEEAFPYLLQALKDERWQVRAQASKTIWKTDREMATEALREALSDENWWVRQNASSSLAKLGEEGVNVLLESLNSEDRFARETAAQALQEIGALEEALRRFADGLNTDQDILVIRKMVGLGCGSPIVQAISSNPDNSLRKKLIEILKGIDEESLKNAVEKLVDNPSVYLSEAACEYIMDLESGNEAGD